MVNENNSLSIRTAVLVNRFLVVAFIIKLHLRTTAIEISVNNRIRVSWDT